MSIDFPLFAYIYIRSKSMKSIEKKIFIGFFFISLIIISLTIVSLISMRFLLNRSSTDKHTLEVLKTIELINLNSLDIETGVRGYLISGDSSFLKPYKSGRDSVIKNLKYLTSLNTYDMKYDHDIKYLNKHLNDLLSTSSKLIYAESNNKTDTLERYQQIIFAKKSMDRIRMIVHEIELENRIILKNINNKNRVLAIFTQYVFAITGVITLISLISIFLIIRGEFKRRKRVEANIKKLNAELESFSYSVSHDLRAPLRAIDGFAKILLEDYGKTLDKEGNRLLDVIINNSNKMSALIDDLLDFSRIGRKDINRINVYLKDLFLEVISEMENIENLKINLNIDEKTVINVDRSMFKIVLTNLLSNSIKYSSKIKDAQINIYEINDEQSYIFCVEDNGVGFDMAFKNKLFEVFQRLHSESEYEGTGVGLALVKRIIEKHGAKVWADSEPNVSTKFYISLPLKYA